jgi:glutamine synthetase
MTSKQIIELVKNHPAGKVKIAITDIDGVLRGKYISTEKFLSVAEDSLGFCDVVFGWDMSDMAYDNIDYTGWHTGYPDAKARIDLSTFRQIPWENGQPFFLADFVSSDNKALPICPRQLLKKITAKANKMGFLPMVAQEFEWFNFEETPQSAADKNYTKLQQLTPGMFGYSILRTTLRGDFFTDLFDLISKFDIPIEGLHTETGPGVYEAAIRYGKVLDTADRATLFKTSVKEIGYLHNVLPTFMAKVSESLPGCSGHVHQSLWDTKEQKIYFLMQKRRIT